MTAPSIRQQWNTIPTLPVLGQVLLSSRLQILLTPGQVIIGYTGAAGIAVVLIIVHYFVAFQPMLDSFRDETNPGGVQTAPFKANPVDLMILTFFRRPFGGDPRRVRLKRRRWRALDTRLTKCILSMSDLQLATGLAILISGYTQLRCGIVSYHWRILGRVAWFSSLTHLSCLTFLRNYLYNHRAQRQWRLFFMLVLIVLLTANLVSMGGEQWFSGDAFEPATTDYAICFYPVKFTSEPEEAFWSMILLVSLIVFGFIFRIVKLHYSLALFVVKSLRQRTSQLARRLLWMLVDWKSLPGGPKRLAAVITYYPAMASFLSLRLVTDHFSSMFFEVYWLFISYLVGLLGLLVNLNILWQDPDLEYLYEGVIDNTWSFGQIVPILLLALPLVNVLESLYSGTTTTPANPTNWPPPKACPDKNYYEESTAMGAGTLHILICGLAISGFALLHQIGWARLAMPIFDLEYGLIAPPIGLWVVMLVSLLIDRVVWEPKIGVEKRWWRKKRRVILQTVNVVVVAGISTFLMFRLTLYIVWY
ncbi:hypothetical protein BJY01DRAFT_248160 [Aspergillus pseudoustus]|uniref:Uncharacterized protein n=1 Tax=Aspergillus pseudoustus TaxID=1810923 RepID=A0ABR4JZY7_9EURO